MSEYNRHKFAMEWMHGGGRDPHGRSLDDEIRIGKEDWMERQRVAAGGRIGLQSGQLVQPGPGRQGYQGAHDKGAGERLREEITEATNKKYADIVKEKKIKGKYSDITDATVKSQIRSLHSSRHVTPYEKKGFIRSKELIESNFKNFDKFSKSGQSIDDFYALFKDKTFKLNLRDYLKGRAGSGITKAFDDLSFKTKYEKIIPKLTKHLEVWHEREPDPGKTKLKQKQKLISKEIHGKTSLTQIQGDPDTHLHHSMRKSKTIPVTGTNLLYIPGETNVGLITNKEGKIMGKGSLENMRNSIERRRNNLIKNKPVGWERKVIDLNNQGTNLAIASEGKLQFQVIEPGGKKYDITFGSEKYQLDRINALKGKDIKNWTQADFDLIKLNQAHVKKTALRDLSSKKTVPYSPRKYSAAAVAEELINHPLAGRATKLARQLGLEFEAAFIALEFMNNLGKGIAPGESFQRSLQTASFGLYKGGDRKLMENVKKAAEELGFDPRVMGSLMKINERGYKQQKELARDENLIAKYTEYAKNNPDQADKADKAIEELKERRKKDYETWGKGTNVLVKEYFTNLKRSKKTMNITNEDINQSVENLQKSALSKVEKERIAKAKEKSTQVDVEAGPIGDVIQNTIGGIFTYPKYAFDVVNPLSPLPKWGGWKTEGMKEKERIEDMQEKGAPGELYRYNIARGYDIEAPLTGRAVQSEIAESPFFGWKAEGGRVSYLDGGIVSLLKK